MIRTTVHPDAPIAVHVAVGELSMEEIRATLRKHFASRAFDPRRPALWDLRAASTARLRPGDVQSLAELVSGEPSCASLTRRTCVAIVVSRPADWGVGRMFQGHMDALEGPKEVRVFYDAERAVRWLTDTCVRRRERPCQCTAPS